MRQRGFTRERDGARGVRRARFEVKIGGSGIASFALSPSTRFNSNFRTHQQCLKGNHSHVLLRRSTPPLSSPASARLRPRRATLPSLPWRPPPLAQHPSPRPRPTTLLPPWPSPISRQERRRRARSRRRPHPQRRRTNSSLRSRAGSTSTRTPGTVHTVGPSLDSPVSSSSMPVSLPPHSTSTEFRC